MRAWCKLTRRQAEQGDAEYQFRFGLSCEDAVEAVKWFRRAAEQKHEDAQFQLGEMYENGLGVQQDYAEAVKWFRRAAEQGDAMAQSNLGFMYSNGQGLQQDYAEAVKWYRRAAEQGHAEAQYNLGAAYGSGRGVQQDSSKAVLWFEKAASLGFDPAKRALEQIRILQARASSADPPVSSSDARSVCAHCASQAPIGTSLKSCSRCGIVLYCGRDCQLAHWKAGHKKSCKARKGK